MISVNLEDVSSFGFYERWEYLSESPRNTHNRFLTRPFYKNHTHNEKKFLTFIRDIRGVRNSMKCIYQEAPRVLNKIFSFISMHCDSNRD